MSVPVISLQESIANEIRGPCFALALLTHSKVKFTRPSAAFAFVMTSLGTLKPPQQVRAMKTCQNM